MGTVARSIFSHVAFFHRVTVVPESLLLKVKVSLATETNNSKPVEYSTPFAPLGGAYNTV